MSDYTEKSYAEEAKRSSQCEQQMHVLEKAIAEAREVAAALETRLSKVLPEGLIAAADAHPEEVLVPLAEWMRQQWRSLNDTNQRLSHLLGSVEL